MNKELNVHVLKESMIKDKELYDVVLSYEYLRSVCYKNISEQSYKACLDVARNLNSLLKTTLDNDDNNLMVCRTYKGYVWVLEVDYLDDEMGVYTATNWPSPEELKAEGCDSLVGESIVIEELNDVIEDMQQDDLTAQDEALQGFFDELEESTFNELVLEE